MKIMQILFIAFLLCKLSLQYENSNIIKILNDFLVKLNFSSRHIRAFVCWSKENEILLMKTLWQSNFTAMISRSDGHFVNAFPYTQQIFLLDAGCKHTGDILRKAERINLFRLPFRWVVWGHTNRSIFEDFYLRLDCKFFIIEEDHYDNIFLITSLYKISENSSHIVENKVGEWSPKSGFIEFNDLLSRNRTNLMHLTINVSYTAMFNDSYNHLDDFRDPHRDPTLKVNAILVKYALEMLNATTFNIYQSAYGFKLSNSNVYNGVVGDLQTGRAEISGNVLFMYVDRVEVVDYLLFCCHSCLRFIYRAPPLSYVSNLFKLPFTVDVWYSCMGLIVIISITVYIITTWEATDPVFKNNKQHNNAAKLEPAWFDIILVQLGAITQQGAEAEPKSISGRMVFVFTFISILFLYTAYTANIVALLQSTSDVIKNSEDLVNSGIGLGLRNISFVLRLLETSTEPITKAVYQKVSEKGRRSNILDLEEGMNRVRKEFFAFQTDPSVAYGIVKKTFQESEKCDLRQVRLLQTSTPHIVMRKHSPYKEIVKVGLTKLLSSGIQKRLVARVYNRKPECKGKGGTYASAAIVDCYAAYLIYGIGLAMASILLLAEIYSHMKLKTCHKRWKHALVNKISIKTLLNKYN